MKSYIRVALLLVPLTVSAQSDPAPQTCKSVPGSPNWPSDAEWSQLDTDLEGRLLTPLPPAVVCDPSKAYAFDPVKCETVGKLWNIAQLHTGNPVSAFYPNWQRDACLPTSVYNTTTDCDLTAYPRYAVNATEASHVVTALKFAAAKSVRLSIKGTGHDFLGRSSAVGMSIWTHNIRGIEVHSSFIPSGCEDCEGEPAMTVASGHNWAEVYTVGKDNGVIVVGGAGPSVGLGGYLTGGGHSPISAKYGLAVDNTLELVVVTPQGEVLVANEYQNQDLFWAMKGGGGSTFGVLMSATLKTIPVFPVTKVNLYFSSTQLKATLNNNSAYYSALAYFYTMIPEMTDSYITGYFQSGTREARPGSGIPTTPVLQDPLFLQFTGWGLNETVETVNNVLDPLRKRLESDIGLVTSLNVTSTESIYDVVRTEVNNKPLSAGFNMVVGSRLWDKDALADEATLADLFRSFDPPKIQGLMTAGPGVRNAVKADKSSANPAWRRAYIHLSTTFAYRNATQEQDATYRNTFVNTAKLRNHAPGMGCYVNEADVREPDHQQAFWGTNYERLLEIKHKYDPQAVFWCPVCVGAEEFELDTNSGQLCSVT